MAKPKIDLSAHCRSCLKQPSDADETFELSMDFRVQFEKCTELSVPEDPTSLICSECWTKCESWLELRKRSQINDQKIKRASVRNAKAFDLAVLCRACLMEPPDLDSYELENDFKALFEKCTDLVIPTDAMQLICFGCWDECESWSKFRKQSQLSDQRIKRANGNTSLSPAIKKARPSLSPVKKSPMALKSPSTRSRQRKTVDTEKHVDSVDIIPYTVTKKDNPEEEEEQYDISPLNSVKQEQVEVLQQEQKEPEDEEVFLEEVGAEEDAGDEYAENEDQHYEFAEVYEENADDPEDTLEDPEQTDEEGLLECPLCVVKSQTPPEYDRHIRDHYKRHTSNDCLVCGKLFNSLTSVIKHTFDHGNMHVSCSHCQRPFKGLMQLRSHLNKYHREAVAEDKSQLQRSFSSVRVASGAKGVAIREGILCPICSQLTEVTRMRGHFKEHYLQSVDQLQCHVCAIPLTDLTDAIKHTFLHTTLPVGCYYCSRQFASEETLQQHLELVHTNIAGTRQQEEEVSAREINDILKCPICEVQFFIEDVYDRHIKSHYDANREPVCQVCSRTFTCVQNAIIHTHEHSSRNVPCPYCAKVYKGGPQLRAHVNKYHLSEYAQLNPVTPTKRREKVVTLTLGQVLACPMCQREFEDESHFSNHVKAHYQPTDRKCRLCPQTFGYFWLVVNHMYEHTGHTFLCSVGYCNKSFSTPYHLRKHHMKYHKEELKEEEGAEEGPPSYYTCEFCAQVFGSRTDLRDHIISDHGDPLEETAETVKAEETGGGEGGLGLKEELADDTVEDCADEIQFQCLQGCDRVFEERDEWLAHKKECVLGKEDAEDGNEINNAEEGEGSEDISAKDLLRCPICHRHFPSEKIYELHIRRHYKGATQFNCLICQKHFKSLSNVCVHTEEHGTRRCECRFCGRCFKGRMKLKAHENKYHNVELSVEKDPDKPLPSFVCEECGKVFMQKFRLALHMNTHTGWPKGREFQCSLCPMVFKTHYSIKVHERKHTGQPEYPCQLCDLKFYHAKSLRDHQRRHSVKKEHECSVCQKLFSYKSGLKEHMNVHTREREFRCDVCGKVFAKISVLYRHKESHLGKHFECGDCGKVCKSMVLMKRHVLTHRNNKVKKEEQEGVEIHERQHEGVEELEILEHVEEEEVDEDGEGEEEIEIYEEVVSDQ